MRLRYAIVQQGSHHWGLSLIQLEARTLSSGTSEPTAQTVETAEANIQKNLHAWVIEPCLGCRAYLLFCLLLTLWCLVSSTQSQLDDSRWARRRGVWVWGGREVPEEPLAFTLPSLVQVVFLVTFFACSLVVVILFQVPHWWPAMFLKVLLVLCIRINDFRECKPHICTYLHILYCVTFCWLFFGRWTELLTVVKIVYI